LLVTPVFHGSLGNYCKRAFEDLGHQVEVFDYREQTFGRDYLTRKGRSLLAKIFSRLAPPVPRMNRKLLRYAEQVRPDLLLAIKGELILPGTVQKLVEQMGFPALLWYPDAVRFLSERPAMQNITRGLKYYTVSFFCDLPGLAPEILNSVRRPEYLTFGCDPSVHKDWPLTREEKERYGSDISFVGNSHGEGSKRDELLKQLLPLNIRIWGTAWKRSPLYQQRPSSFHGPAYGDELAKIYSASRIALNINGDYPVMNVRNFEAPACGVMLLTSEIPPLPDYFIPGVEVATFRDAGEVRAKASYYLEHEGERRAIAAAGQERALKDHTIKRRMETVLAVYREVTGRPASPAKVNGTGSFDTGEKVTDGAA
jgi:spore maturation protein CgeB